MGEKEQSRAEAAMARMAVGDRQAMADIYARYSHGIYGYIRSIVLDGHEAEDLTQQVFVKLMTAARGSSPVCVDFSAWLLRVARNTALDSLRRTKRTRLLDPHQWSPAVAAPDHEARRSLEDALSSLSAGQRDVLILRDLIGLTPHEAAERLGKSDGAVHMLHHRARRAARERLAGSGGGPSTRRRQPEAA
jgi:RNA polymerase sigma-70 factor, ECF subfamily